MAEAAIKKDTVEKIDSYAGVKQAILKEEKPEENVPVITDEFIARTPEGDAINAIVSLCGALLTNDTSSALGVSKDTRNLLALFENGVFLVSDTHRFDGRVLTFQVLAKKHNVIVNDPIYVPMSFIANVYNSYGKSKTGLSNNKGVNNQMQREFVDIVTRAAKLGVSDIHVVVGTNQTQIMFRISGSMKTVLEYDKTWGDTFVRAVFASADISDSNYSANEYQAAQKLGSTPLRGEQNLYMPSNILGIRLQFNPIAFGSAYLVMRLLYANTSSANSESLKALGYTSYETKRFFRMRNFPVGLCIVAGPTGSGKSTTLQRLMIKMLKEKNYELNLITVEDPPEYPIPGARQMPVTNAENEEAKEIAFTKALAASLRSDPDALMVGETRTLSAAELIFKGALSGHNVWTTIHANSAPAILLRLLDMGVDKFKLKDAEIVRGLLSQRLFKKLCPHCRKPLKDFPENPTYERVKKSLGDFGINQTYITGDGCDHCKGKGIVGRTVCGEIIMTDSKFLDLIMENNRVDAVNYWIDSLEGRTLKESAISQMLQGQIDAEEVERWCGFLDVESVY
ncbi:MAG: Flp pilus assembly complex ATPase component TadA [Rickettsiales bacterium]|nr:Flp pilus assembly complex ATPase component TadA [Rickettsiales bacterium]